MPQSGNAPPEPQAGRGGTVSILPDEPAATRAPEARAGHTASVAPGAADPLEGEPTLPDGPIGRFEVRRFLGEGSFGRVYEAYDPTLKRVVALKVAKAEQMSSPRRAAPRPT
jgi:hypothetical protein